MRALRRAPAIHLVATLLALSTRVAASDPEWHRNPPALRGLKPGHATLADVRRVLGDAPTIWVVGTPAASLCYHVTAPSGERSYAAFRTGFTSRPDAVSEILLSAAPPSWARERCVAARGRQRTWALSNGLAVGTTRADVRRILGDPDDDDATPLTWTSPTWPLDRGCSGVAAVEIEVADGRARSVVVIWTESC